MKLLASIERSTHGKPRRSCFGRAWLLLLSCWALSACGHDARLPEPALAAQFPSWVPIVPLEVDDRGPLPFLLDTGADVLRLSPALAQELGSAVQTLRFGDHARHDVPFSSYDTKTLSGLVGLPLAGIAGNQLYDDLVVTIDYRGQRVYPLASWRDDVVFGDHIAGPLERVPLQLAGPTKLLLARARFEDLPAERTVVVDTGTSSAVISQSLFEALGAHEDGRTVLRGSQAISSFGDIDSPIVRIRSLRLGRGKAARYVWATVLPDLLFFALSLQAGAPVDAIVGGAFLREFLVAVDYPAAQLRLARYRDLTPLAGEFDKVGVELIQRDGAFEVFTVFEGSDAATRGIARGDRLERVDGAEVASLSLAEVNAKLKGEPGTSVMLTLGSSTRGGYSVEVRREALLPL